LASKFAKTANMRQKNGYCNNSVWIFKDAKLDDYIKSVEKSAIFSILRGTDYLSISLTVSMVATLYR
jgi:hypothetical protein